MHRFFAAPEQFHEGSVTLDPSETRHLRDVLRVKPGDAVQVFDGAGREFTCRITAVSKKAAQLTIETEIQPSSPESPLDLTLAAAMLKGEKFDLVVQKAVELGVRSLVPLRTIRCDVRPKEALTRTDRWRRIALEATKQSGRATLMHVSEPVDFAKLISATNSATILMFTEREGGKFITTTPVKKLTAIVGPEGGWDDSEIEAAKAAGLQVVTLSGRILRAETAAIAVISILQHRFGDLN